MKSFRRFIQANAKRLTEEDIAVITVQSLESTVFQMVDAQVAGDYGEAFLLMHRLLESGEDRMMILAMLLRQYRMLYQTTLFAG